MSDTFELEICQGKYRYRYEAGKQEVWRNGRPWSLMNNRLIGNKFVFSLAFELNEARKELESWKGLAKQFSQDADALRAKIETMERQEPVGTLHDDGCFVWRETAPHQSNYAGWKMVLYALPGAKGEDK